MMRISGNPLFLNDIHMGNILMCLMTNQSINAPTPPPGIISDIIPPNPKG